MPGHDYLFTEAAQARYAIAAQWVRSCTEVLEIGGAATPITDHLVEVPRRVVVVDPSIEERRADVVRGRACRVEHRAARFQDVELDMTPGEYGLVMLGLGLRHFRTSKSAPRAGGSIYAAWRRWAGDRSSIVQSVLSGIEHRLVDRVDNVPNRANRADFARLIDLIDGSKVTVIGIPDGFWLSERQLAFLLERTSSRVTTDLVLSLDEAQVPARWRHRRMLKLT